MHHGRVCFGNSDDVLPAFVRNRNLGTAIHLGSRLLDVGSGLGVITCELADTRLASATVVEASPAYLEVARREVGSK
jgi:2-polyprenyl-3-methyl-5-hydroxy-6-metoxy-1,4-benzoquinol methylase